MKTWIVSLLLFASTSVWATGAPVGTLGTVPSMTVAGRVFTDLTNLKVLVFGVGSTGNVRSSFRAPGATSGYTVTSGKTLTIEAISYAAVQATNANDLQIGYADNDTGWFANTAPTNPIYLGATSTAIISFNLGISNNVTVQQLYRFAIPQNKIPFIQANSANGAVSGFAYGYEN